METMTQDPPIHVLKRVWGFDSFLGQQEAAVEAALHGRDSLVVFPTGGGKSITYQLPALMKPGTAVVVSPLIALMKDQVDALRDNGVPAATLNSAMTPWERGETVRRLREGALKLLYVSPEGLLTDGMLDLLESCRPSFFAIDEAHCISHWGHDFRQEYRALGSLRDRFPSTPFHACTATATPPVQEDILRSLRLHDPAVFVSSFDRPNLVYRFIPRASLRTQLEEVLERHRNHAGIVYCLSRKDVENTARHLASQGWRAVPYHAGMSADDRHANQEAFSNEQVDVVVATVAFGMGIDRSDVRFVVHTGMPKSVEHYQQEAGRAGRDGLEAECVLLYSGQDVVMWRNLLAQPTSDLERVASDKLSEMYRLARSLSCRHRALVRYFGQELDTPETGCGACDHCLGENEVLEDSVTVARKILSCVARVRERFGARYVAEVLKGARHARIVENNHDQLSTHGLLSEYPVETIGHWIDQLIACEFLARSEGEFPTVTITEAGQRLMRQSEGTIALSRPVKKEKHARSRDDRARGDRSRDAEDLGPYSEDLFELLRAIRRNLAAARGVPPYIIFSDASLVDMARRLPTSPEAFRRVKGVGDQKAASLAEHFLPPIQAWLATNAAPAPRETELPLDAAGILSPRPERTPDLHADLPGPTRRADRPPHPLVDASAPRPVLASPFDRAPHPLADASAPRPEPDSGSANGQHAPPSGQAAETRPRPKGKDVAFALLADGVSIESAAQQTGRASSTLESDLFEYLQEHPEADVAPWLEAGTLERVLPLLEASEDGRLAPIFETLDGQVSYRQLRLAKVVLTRRLLPRVLDA